MEFANINKFATEGVIEARSHNIINSPMFYSKHWPSDDEQRASNKMINYS